MLEACLNFIENLKGISWTDFHCNYLLCGHFNILAAIYQQKPALINPNIVSFLLKNCLALDSKVTNDPLFRKMEHVTEAFKFINHILVVTKDARLV